MPSPSCARIRSKSRSSVSGITPSCAGRRREWRAHAQVRWRGATEPGEAISRRRPRAGGRRRARAWARGAARRGAHLAGDARHGVGLARAGGPVGEYGAIEPVEHVLDQVARRQVEDAAACARRRGGSRASRAGEREVARRRGRPCARGEPAGLRAAWQRTHARGVRLAHTSPATSSRRTRGRTRTASRASGRRPARTRSRRPSGRARRRCGPRRHGRSSRCPPSSPARRAGARAPPP